MSKGLEALEPIKKMFCPHWSLENYEIVEKELKAFEIIKAKPEFLIHIICHKTYEDFKQGYYKRFPNMPTEEEFDLLKEVLL